ncbi:fungal specific transcription factor domain containing protein [Colletotrichum karsti]|uniref:Fungal specific transcription factor domain containing protein n=1 Tax=Colletotrichum karsti TaxID=1095194 RepID=A0A9P6IFL0_9PEZI|nr:fungal specific transcription factor domain containing protein [Colletotrichum karsti]KAF9881825.1 fungal specific transcription factor domain containing protein [Colletotrichum karsti]
MPAHSPPSPALKPTKRPRQGSYDEASPNSGGNDQSPAGDNQNDPIAGAGAALLADKAGGKPGQSSNFRNVSACNRCRLRKNRCDQKLPSCASCAKANVACVGYDPITKKEIPRRHVALDYVFYLETRVEQLEALLANNNVPIPPADNLEICSRPGTEAPRSTTDAGHSARSESLEGNGVAKSNVHRPDLDKTKKADGGAGTAMLDIVAPSKPRSLASASGVSFNRVVFAAVQYSVSDQNGSDRAGGKGLPIGSGTSMRDSFFGLHTKPTIRPANFPEREVGMRLVTLYFEHANPQIPILHRGEFMQMFEQAYANQSGSRGPRELYMLNMVFAIGCGVIVGEPVKSDGSGAGPRNPPDANKFGQAQPEEYHASAIVHLEACLGNSGGGLEVLQAVLLLANFALLRPVPPGLWYIIGVAVRLAVDLGLHYEDGSDVAKAMMDPLGKIKEENGEIDGSNENRSREKGRRLYIRDMRRRLWWCCYSLDRLVGTCVGRPFGISDQVITTEFPSLLDDQYITPTGFLEMPPDSTEPSYKHVAYHYFKLRLLQSEILQVLQYNQTQVVRASGQNLTNSDMHTHLPSPFLIKFDSFRSWRIDIDRRLYQWKNTAPTREQTGVAFSTEFLELNYWQAIIMLYRQSLSVPAMFEGEYNTSNEVNSPTAFQAELREDEDRIYLKVAEAGQKILRIYRQLHLSGLVSYTYLSTHHLFMAGISYLYAIWHSPIVRSRLTMDEVDFTILAAKSVFTDLIDKCLPAETCRDAFDRTAKATIKMANSTGGFGSVPPRKMRENRFEWSSASGDGASTSTASAPRRRPQQQQFQQGNFQAERALSDTLSSPSLSVAGDLPPRNSPLATDFNMMGQGSPSEIDPSFIASPPVPRRMPAQRSSSGGSFMNQQQQQGPYNMTEYPDIQNMDFFQSLQGNPNGEMGASADGTTPNLDLGFGINWDNMHHDFSDGQQMSIFDGFFFGGQQQQQAQQQSQQQAQDQQQGANGGNANGQ